MDEKFQSEWMEGDAFSVEQFRLKPEDCTSAQWDAIRRLHDELFLTTLPLPSKYTN